MGRLGSNDGFTLAGVCLAVAALSAFTVAAASSVPLPDTSCTRWASGYLLAQAEAMRSARRTECPAAGEWPSVSFNEKGNVSLAQTVRAGSREAVIGLGGGRLIFR